MWGVSWICVILYPGGETGKQGGAGDAIAGDGMGNGSHETTVEGQGAFLIHFFLLDILKVGRSLAVNAPISPIEF